MVVVVGLHGLATHIHRCMYNDNTNDGVCVWYQSFVAKVVLGGPRQTSAQLLQ